MVRSGHLGVMLMKRQWLAILEKLNTVGRKKILKKLHCGPAV